MIESILRTSALHVANVVEALAVLAVTFGLARVVAKAAKQLQSVYILPSSEKSGLFRLASITDPKSKIRRRGWSVPRPPMLLASL